jgi:hypothetical protein
LLVNVKRPGVAIQLRDMVLVEILAFDFSEINFSNSIAEMTRERRRHQRLLNAQDERTNDRRLFANA